MISNCGSCGGQYEYNQIKCPYCGRINNALERTACPICMKEDKVFKISLLLDSKQDNFNIFSNIKTRNIFDKLAPPIKPEIEKKFPTFRILLEIVISSSILFVSNDSGIFKNFQRLVYYLARGEYFQYYMILLFILGVVGYADVIYKIIDYLLTGRKIKGDYELELESWNKQMNRWKASYYCGRDDVVFIPIENKAYHALDMINFMKQ